MKFRFAFCFLMLVVANGYAQADTTFCRVFTNFLVFNQNENNAKELSKQAMGMDTLRREGEDDLDFTIRTTRASIARLLYADFDIYNVHYSIYSSPESYIYHKKTSGLIYYREDLPTANLPNDGISTNYQAGREQLVSLLKGCTTNPQTNFIQEPFDPKAHLTSEELSFFGKVQMDVFKSEQGTDLRYVVHTENGGLSGHLRIYLIHKNFLKDIVK